MTETRLHLSGIPTDIELRQLTDTYPTSGMKAGDVFTYEEIAALIKTKVKSYRFRTITNRWRATVERETGIRIGAYQGEFFRVMTESEKLEAIENKDGSIVKQLRKNIRRIPMVERNKLNNDEIKRLDHHTLKAQNMIATSQLRGKQVRFIEEQPNG